jgi:DNA-binding NarL/FixJ family response regulator
MNIVIVEDDLNKLRQIADMVQSEVPTAHVAECHSYQSGLSAIVNDAPDLVIVDMSMPTFDIAPGRQGGRTRAYGGRDILAEVVRRQLPSKVVVVTQFESFHDRDGTVTLSQLRRTLERNYSSHYLMAIYYNAAESTWRTELSEALRRMAQP